MRRTDYEWLSKLADHPNMEPMEPQEFPGWLSSEDKRGCPEWARAILDSVRYRTNPMAMLFDWSYDAMHRDIGIAVRMVSISTVNFENNRVTNSTRFGPVDDNPEQMYGPHGEDLLKECIARLFYDMVTHELFEQLVIGGELYRDPHDIIGREFRKKYGLTSPGPAVNFPEKSPRLGLTDIPKAGTFESFATAQHAAMSAKEKKP